MSDLNRLALDSLNNSGAMPTIEAIRATRGVGYAVLALNETLEGTRQAAEITADERAELERLQAFERRYRQFLEASGYLADDYHDPMNLVDPVTDQLHDMIAWQKECEELQGRVDTARGYLRERLESGDTSYRKYGPVLKILEGLPTDE